MCGGNVVFNSFVVQQLQTAVAKYPVYQPHHYPHVLFVTVVSQLYQVTEVGYETGHNRL